MGGVAPPGDAGPERIRAAVSWLFVPGDRPERFAKAAASGAHVVVCDLEDAVAVDAKQAARNEVRRWLLDGGSACVRINPAGTALAADDVAALAGVPGLLAVMVPKAEDPDALVSLAARLPGIPLVALVETALGIHLAHEVAAVPAVTRLAFGSVDLALDLGATDADLPLLLARSSLVLASRVAGLPAPVDGVTQALDDPSVVERSAAAATELGFGGKLCIHPRQVGAVHAGFRPGDEEISRARRILAAAPSGAAARVDGQMVDAPVLERARRLLALVDSPEPSSPTDHPTRS